MGQLEAEKVLGLTGSYDKKAVADAYKEKIKTAHPDAGGSADMTKQLNAAKVCLNKLFADEKLETITAGKPVNRVHVTGDSPWQEYVKRAEESNKVENSYRYHPTTDYFVDPDGKLHDFRGSNKRTPDDFRDAFEKVGSVFEQFADDDAKEGYTKENIDNIADWAYIGYDYLKNGREYFRDRKGKKNAGTGRKNGKKHQKTENHGK